MAPRRVVQFSIHFLQTLCIHERESIPRSAAAVASELLCSDCIFVPFVNQSLTQGPIIRRVLVVSKAATRKVTALAVHYFATAVAVANPGHGPSSPTSIFSPVSTPAQSIYGLSLFVLALTAAVFVLVFGLLAYAVITFRESTRDDRRELPQVYGSSEVETAWTVIPVLIVLFCSWRPSG